MNNVPGFPLSEFTLSPPPPLNLTLLHKGFVQKHEQTLQQL